MIEIKMRIWHEGNEEFEFVTLADIWVNGWMCCEANNTPTEKEKNGRFSTECSLKKKAKTSFIVNGEHELFIGIPDKNGHEIYDGDILEYKTGKEVEVRWCKQLANYSLWDIENKKWFDSGIWAWEYKDFVITGHIHNQKAI